MIDCTPSGLIKEIEFSENRRQSYLSMLEPMRKAFTSPFYDSASPAEFDRENTPYTYAARMMSKLAFDNPKAKCRSRAVGAPRFVALALKHGLDRQIQEADLQDPLMDAIYDSLFAYGMVHTRLVENYDRPMVDWMLEDDEVTPRKDFRPLKPESEAIEPERCILDPVAKTPRKMRYIGHAFAADIEDLKREAKKDPESWNLDVVESLSPTADEKKLGREAIPGMPNRKEVVCYYIWVPEARLDDADDSQSDKHHGVIYTLGVGVPIDENDPKSRKFGFVRKPYKFYGPRWGPYTMFGIYRSRRSAFPLAPLMATWGQHKELNDHLRAQSDSSAARKVIALIDELDTLLGSRLANAKDGDIIPVNGLERAKVVPLALGGADPVREAIIVNLRELRDRTLGQSDAGKGVATGEATATENIIARDATSDIVAFQQRMTRKSAAQVVRTWAWYDYYNDSVVFQHSEEAATALQQEGINQQWFYGGSFDAIDGMTFDDLEVDIELESMERVTEESRQMRMQVVYNAYLSLMPIAPQIAPFCDIKGLLDAVGETLNMPNAGDYFDADKVPDPPDTESSQERAAAPAPKSMTKPQAPIPPQQTPVAGNRGGDRFGSPKQAAQTNQTLNGAQGATRPQGMYQ